jgi:hypothetical protein
MEYTASERSLIRGQQMNAHSLNPPPATTGVSRPPIATRCIEAPIERHDYREFRPYRLLVALIFIKRKAHRARSGALRVADSTVGLKVGSVEIAIRGFTACRTITHRVVRLERRT